MVVSALAGHLIWIKAADHSVMLYWFSPRGKSERSFTRLIAVADVGVIRAGYAVGTPRA
jgi:hypothetical protein